MFHVKTGQDYEREIALLREENKSLCQAIAILVRREPTQCLKISEMELIEVETYPQLYTVRNVRDMTRDIYVSPPNNAEHLTTDESCGNNG